MSTSWSVSQHLKDELNRRIRQCTIDLRNLEDQRQRALLAELTGQNCENSLADIDGLIAIAQRRLKRLDRELDRVITSELERLLDRGGAA